VLVFDEGMHLCEEPLETSGLFKQREKEVRAKADERVTVWRIREDQGRTVGDAEGGGAKAPRWAFRALKTEDASGMFREECVPEHECLCKLALIIRLVHAGK